MSFFAPVVANIWETIESYGIDPAPYFKAEGIKLSLPINPADRVPSDKLYKVFGMALEQINDPYFGIRTGQNIHPSHLGALGYGWLASGSLREAFTRLQRYIRLINPRVSLQLEDDPGGLKITYLLDMNISNPSILADSQMASLFTMSRMIAGKNFHPKSVQFMHVQPPDTGEYFKFFKCPLEFLMPGNALIISADDADHLLHTGNPQLAQINDQVVIRRLAALDKDDIVSGVQAAILDSMPSGNISDDNISRQLNMTTRTMRRRLQEKDLTFRNVLTQIRRELADQYIRDTSLTLTEVSYMLGFSETSSFSRAFKNWTGMAPSTARGMAVGMTDRQIATML